MFLSLAPFKTFLIFPRQHTPSPAVVLPKVFVTLTRTYTQQQILYPSLLFYTAL